MKYYYQLKHQQTQRKTAKTERKDKSALKKENKKIAIEILLINNYLCK